MTEGRLNHMDAHTQIDIEMKHEGDLLVGRARLTALSLALLLGLVIAVTYALAAKHIARPLRALAATADRVAHHDLSAQFPSWPSRDEVGTLAGSLTTMLVSLREHSTSLLRKTKELEAFTYSIAHDLKGPLREIEGFSSLLEKHFSETDDQEVKHHIGVIRQSALRLTHMPGASDDNALIVPRPAARIRPVDTPAFQKIVADVEISVGAASAIDAVMDVRNICPSDDDIAGVREGDSPGARANRHGGGPPLPGRNGFFVFWSKEL